MATTIQRDLSFLDIYNYFWYWVTIYVSSLVFDCCHGFSSYKTLCQRFPLVIVPVAIERRIETRVEILCCYLVSTHPLMVLSAFVYHFYIVCFRLSLLYCLWRFITFIEDYRMKSCKESLMMSASFIAWCTSVDCSPPNVFLIFDVLKLGHSKQSCHKM